ADISVPDWVGQMLKSGVSSFYKRGKGTEAHVPGKGYIEEQEPADEIQLSAIKTVPKRILFERKEAALLDLGDAVALYEFRSKANSIGNDVIEGIIEAIDWVEQGNFLGLVIGNDGRNFSAGANLGEVAQVLLEGKFDLLEKITRRFQEMIMRIRYARKPVVAAVQGMALGGGCEITMASAQVAAATETYIGLVELGVGFIPAGCGTTYLTAQAAHRAASEFSSDIQTTLNQAFQTIATAKVATSAHEATELDLLRKDTRIVMNPDRRLHVAREEVIRLAHQGYLPPPVRNAIPVLGQPGRAVLEVAAHQMQQAGYASEYDRYLAGRLAYIMTGGAISAPTTVHEDYLFELEREVFLSLLGEKKTQERIQSILTTNKPLRN
ncbi:MAG: enoyl-CoA hydratase/isomerase family protein, partial [bacterium]